jgi:hypothetical protein
VPTFVYLDRILTPLGYAQVAAGSLTPAQGLPSIPKGATIALLQAEGSNARWTDDGSTPTATVGMLLLNAAAGEQMYYGDLSKIKVIQTAGTTILNVTYYKIG